jgi:hypothetical protein
MKNLIITSLVLFGTLIIGYSQNGSNDIFDNLPDSIPKIFAKGLISIEDRYEYGLAISKDYQELFFTAERPGNGLMVMRKQNDGNWTTPKMANLRGNNSWEYEAFYNSNGQRLYFTSDINDTSRLWFSEKVNAKWTMPRILDSPVNDTPVFWATFTKDNTMYYTNLAVFRIYKSILINDKYEKIQDLGLPFGIHPFVSEDENFILFNGNGDIYITFKKDANSWSEPISLGNQINTLEFQESCPSLSPDKKYIFFSRYNDLNKKSDIYWVSSGIIDKIRNDIIKK